jgi:hypothetical protein
MSKLTHNKNVSFCPTVVASQMGSPKRRDVKSCLKARLPAATKYQVGDIVWARKGGKQPWPARVEKIVNANQISQ